MSAIMSLLIALVCALFLLAMVIGSRHCTFIALVSKATDHRGIENLARYLERRAVSPSCSSPTNWRYFLPAAREMAHVHLLKVQRRMHKPAH
jgi:acyl-coenzyme A synthetase/AMP-(fatty) acid ligase